LDRIVGGGPYGTLRVKTTEADGPHGYDAGNTMNGPKRHTLTDTVGLLVNAIVHPADVQDCDDALELLKFPCVSLVFVMSSLIAPMAMTDCRANWRNLANTPWRSSRDDLAGRLDSG